MSSFFAYMAQNLDHQADIQMLASIIIVITVPDTLIDDSTVNSGMLVNGPSISEPLRPFKVPVIVTKWVPSETEVNWKPLVPIYM